MDRASFRAKYRDLASTIGAEFGDSPAHDDERIARSMAREFPPDERMRYYDEVISDAHRLMGELDEHWEAIAKEANRQLYSKEAVRDWLVRMVTAWQEELSSLRNGGANPS